MKRLPIRFNSLTVMLTVVILISLGISSFVFMSVHHFLYSQVDNLISTPEFQQKKSTEALKRLQDYIDVNHMTKADASKIYDWEKNNRFVSVLISADNQILYATGSRIEKDDIAYSDMQWLANDTFTFPYSLSFADGKASVVVYNMEDQNYYNMSDIASLLLAFVFFMAIVLFFISKKLNYIRILREEIKILEGGDLLYPLTLKGHDELYDLALGIEEMRMSLNQQSVERENALKANADLVAAMSHDLRTPLTSLLGYIDILHTKKYQNDEQMVRFIQSIRDKAFQIKELSDKMFDYFLVFSRDQEEGNMVQTDAATFLLQVFEEKTMELGNRGFRVEEHFQEIQGCIFINHSLIIRAFDNLFSNIIKYADPAYPVILECGIEDEQRILIRIKNRILSNPVRIESSKIGLKVCDRALNHHNGSIKHESKNGVYTVQIILPLAFNESAL